MSLLSTQHIHFCLMLDRNWMWYSSWCLTRIGKSSPSPYWLPFFWSSLGPGWLSGILPAHVQIFCPPVCPNPCPQSCSQSVSFPSLYWFWLTQVQDLALGLFEVGVHVVTALCLPRSLWLASLPSSLWPALHILMLSGNLLEVLSIPPLFFLVECSSVKMWGE